MQRSDSDRHQGLSEIEERLIGSVLLDSKQFKRVAERIDASDFSRPLFSRTWEAFNTLESQGQPIDISTVSHVLDGLGVNYRIEDLATAAKDTVTPGNITTYAQIVSTHSEGRRLAALLAHYQGIADKHYMTDRSPKEIAGELEIELGQYNEYTAKPVDTSMAVRTLAEQTRALVMGAQKPVLGIDLGLPRINDLTGGGRPKEMSVLAGRPSHGKTAYALRVAACNSIFAEHPIPTIIFSIEMSQEKMLKRLIAMVSGLPFDVVDRPSVEMLAKHKLASGAVVSAIELASQRIAEAPLQIEECAHPRSRRPSGMLSIAKRWAAHYGTLGLIQVDYLQLMEPEPYMEKASDERVISHGSRSMKAMAKQLGCHVMLLSQLNRNLENREGDKRPILADLRGSGSIEQDADIIAFVYQDKLYNPDSPIKDQLEVLIGKNRDGPLTKARARLEMECSRLHANTPEEEAELEERLRQYNARRNGMQTRSRANPRRK